MTFTADPHLAGAVRGVRAEPDCAPGRLGPACLALGAALNTAQAVLTRLVARGETPAAKLADVDRHPVALLVVILAGALGVVLLLVGLQWLARLLAPATPVCARIAAVLSFAGALGFFGMHVVMLLTYAAAGTPDRRAAVAVVEHLDSSPVMLVLVLPFLLGMFGGIATFTVALLRTRSVPRWIPATWALFVPIDVAAAGQSPVDPHWLFLAGAVGLARHAWSERVTAVERRPASTVGA